MLCLSVFKSLERKSYTSNPPHFLGLHSLCYGEITFTFMYKLGNYIQGNVKGLFLLPSFVKWGARILLEESAQFK